MIIETLNTERQSIDSQCKESRQKGLIEVFRIALKGNLTNRGDIKECENIRDFLEGKQRGCSPSEIQRFYGLCAVFLESVSDF